MTIILDLILLLAGAKLLGELCERIGFPSVAGYVVTGIIAGPMLLGISTPEAISVFSDLGIILLLFMIGFQQGSVHDIMDRKKTLFSISLLGYAFPFIASLGIGLYFNLPLDVLLLLVIAVSATSIGTTVKTLIDLKRINTPIGKTMLGVTVIDAILGMVVFTIVLTYITVGQVGAIELLKVLASLLFFFILFVVMEKITPEIVSKFDYFTIEEGQFTFALIFILLLALVAEYLGLHGIIGAFLAGILLSKSSLVETDFIEKLSAISYALFIPLFFVWTGLLLEISSISIISLAIVAGVLVSNCAGATLGALIGGIKGRDALAIGVGVLPRGDINLVIATVGMSLIAVNGDKLISVEMGELILSTVMILVFVSVIVTPLILKMLLGGEKK